MLALLTSLLLLDLLPPFASSLPHVIHEKREEPLENASDRQRIEADALLPMRIGLRQNSHALSRAEEWLMAISDPSSPAYGRHWSQEDVIKAFEPADETLRAVTEWLAGHGIEHFTHTENRQWLAFDLPAHQAEKFLQTRYFEHRNSKGRFEVSCDEYSLPPALREHVDFVMPGVVSRDITGRTARSRQFLLDGM